MKKASFNIDGKILGPLKSLDFYELLSIIN